MLARCLTHWQYAFVLPSLFTGLWSTRVLYLMPGFRVEALWPLAPRLSIYFEGGVALYALTY